MTDRFDHATRRKARLGLLLLGAAVGSAVLAPSAAAASPYPSDTSRPLMPAGSSALAQQARQSRKKPRKPTLKGNPARAELAFQAMQKYYYIPGSGLYGGEPFSSLWPFSQALAATVSMANIPHLGISLTPELRARVVGLHNYLDTANSAAQEETFTSTLPAFDATVAPPAGPGGAKYYDDNDWIGIELARLYELSRSPSLLQGAERIMAFEMAGWQSNPELGCPGGVPFSNEAENSRTQHRHDRSRRRARHPALPHHPQRRVSAVRGDGLPVGAPAACFSRAASTPTTSTARASSNRRSGATTRAP